MRVSAGHTRYLRCISLVIPLFLVMVGMWVPDLSRPSKPKPLRRAVLDKTPTRSPHSSTAKNTVDPFITSQPTFEVIVSENHFPEAAPLRSPTPALPLVPSSPRAPPATSLSA